MNNVEEEIEFGGGLTEPEYSAHELRNIENYQASCRLKAPRFFRSKTHDHNTSLMLMKVCGDALRFCECRYCKITEPFYWVTLNAENGVMREDYTAYWEKIRKLSWVARVEYCFDVRSDDPANHGLHSHGIVKIDTKVKDQNHAIRDLRRAPARLKRWMQNIPEYKGIFVPSKMIGKRREYKKCPGYWLDDKRRYMKGFKEIRAVEKKNHIDATRWYRDTHGLEDIYSLA